MKRASENNKKKIWLVLFIVCISIALLAVGYLIYHNVQLQRRQAEYEDLLRTASAAEAHKEEETSGNAGYNLPAQGEDTAENKENAENIENTEAAADLSAYDVPEKTIDFTVLQEENPDIYAWITIPDTNIDYPVLQHPTELDYYLNYNLDGSKGRPGCICSQFINEKDFSDFNTVLYGHNMRAGTMFANLHYYEDSEFFETHPYVYIYTENGTLVYQVFAAYAFSNVHLLMGFELSREEIRETYLDNIFSLDGLNDNFNREVEVTTDSKILTLSTCIRNQEEKRYIVAAVLVADGRELQPESDGN